MKFVIDMNLARQWSGPLRSIGHDAVHWSRVGPDNASDLDIMSWARDHDHVVLTGDLDFGDELSRSGATLPSVVQLRTSVDDPDLVGPHVLQSITSAQADLERGALLVISNKRSRARPLPISRFR